MIITNEYYTILLIHDIILSPFVSEIHHYIIKIDGVYFLYQYLQLSSLSPSVILSEHLLIMTMVHALLSWQ